MTVFLPAFRKSFSSSVKQSNALPDTTEIAVYDGLTQFADGEFYPFESQSGVAVIEFVFRCDDLSTTRPILSGPETDYEQIRVKTDGNIQYRYFSGGVAQFIDTGVFAQVGETVTGTLTIDYPNAVVDLKTNTGSSTNTTKLVSDPPDNPIYFDEIGRGFGTQYFNGALSISMFDPSPFQQNKTPHGSPTFFTQSEPVVLSGDFEISGWFKFDVSAVNRIFGDASTAFNNRLFVFTNGDLGFVDSSGSILRIVAGLENGNHYHYTLSRVGQNVTLACNGVEGTDSGFSNPLTIDQCFIDGGNYSPSGFSLYNIRMVDNGQLIRDWRFDKYDADYGLFPDVASESIDVMNVVAGNASNWEYLGGDTWERVSGEGWSQLLLDRSIARSDTIEVYEIEIIEISSGIVRLYTRNPSDNANSQTDPLPVGVHRGSEYIYHISPAGQGIWLDSDGGRFKVKIHKVERTSAMKAFQFNEQTDYLYNERINRELEYREIGGTPTLVDAKGDPNPNLPEWPLPQGATKEYL